MSASRNILVRALFGAVLIVSGCGTTAPGTAVSGPSDPGVTADPGSSDPGVTADPGSSSPEADLPEIVITTHDYYFDAPETASGGLVRVTVNNEGPDKHQVELVRARDDVDVAEVIDAVQRQAADEMDALVTYHGGPNEVPAGQSRTAITTLDPGSYVLLCFVFSDRQLHVHRGMVGTLEITEPDVPDTGSPPETGVEVVLDDYTIQVVGDLVPGTNWVWVRNVGSQPHEFRAIGAPSSAGGSSTISAGAETWVELIVVEGRYRLECHVPVPGGVPHFQRGMVGTVAVE
jgi:hypothetical protein